MSSLFHQLCSFFKVRVLEGIRDIDEIGFEVKEINFPIFVTFDYSSDSDNSYCDNMSDNFIFPMDD